MKKMVLVIMLLAALAVLCSCGQKTGITNHSNVYIPEKKIEEKFITETIIEEKIIEEKRV